MKMCKIKCPYLVLTKYGQEIKKSVASYFNPVKLVDKNRSLRGLDDDASRPNNSSDEEQEGEGRPSGSSEEATVSDSELFEDSFRILDNIAEEAKQDVRVSELVASSSVVKTASSNVQKTLVVQLSSKPECNQCAQYFCVGCH